MSIYAIRLRYSKEVGVIGKDAFNNPIINYERDKKKDQFYHAKDLPSALQHLDNNGFTQTAENSFSHLVHNGTKFIHEKYIVEYGEERYVFSD